MNITFHTGRIGSGNSTADREDPLEGRKRNPKTTGSGPYAFPPGWELFPCLRFAGSDSVKNDQSDLESVIYQQCELRRFPGGCSIRRGSNRNTSQAGKNP